MRWIPCKHRGGCQYAANGLKGGLCHRHGGKKLEAKRGPLLVLLSLDVGAPALERFSVLYAQGDKKTGGPISKALARLLANTDVDLDDCSCSAGDPCPGCRLRKAVADAR
jgi:hypothetical protein